MDKIGSVLVIGAGVSGIQASLDLAESGFKVYLVEKSPTIGGRMAQLDKTFPTNDCAMCTLAPKMVETVRHSDIEVMTLSEVEAIDGEEGNFQVTIRRKARYIREDKCTGCGLCAEVCPSVIPNEFDMGLGSRKAAYIPFPQAAPLIYTIDKEHCINCGMCKIVCEADAIDYDMKDEIVKVNVGSIIVSSGYDLYNPSALEEYGYGVYKNVITNLQFERLLSASGPTAGHVIRPSDGKEPKKIAFIQCVGSRDVRHYPYCSQICCMASTKEAIIAKEHSPDLDISIFYMDLRAFGKGFQEYADKAKNTYNVRYIRSRPSAITEDLRTGNLIIHYDDTFTGEAKQEEFEMVVLASALKPSSGSEKLSEILQIETDEYGYFKTYEHAPFNTSRKGIFITGACVGPKDIPDSVGQAGGAAAQVGGLLVESRGTQLSIKQEVPEKEVSGEPRIGVYVCHCGLNIAAVVDVKAVAEYARSLPNVVYATDKLYTCSDDTRSQIKKDIKKYDLNRVIVASCTPRTHEPLFRSTCQEAGLNPYLFELANIREHDAWVHAKDPEKATEKAKDLVRMAVARARLLKPQTSKKIEVGPSALVIGGGIAGMTAALEIAKQGFRVDLVEKSSKLGGSVSEMSTVFMEGIDAKELVDSLVEQVEKSGMITVHLNSVIAGLNGYVGNFEIDVKENGDIRKIKAGAIVIATGSEEMKPKGMFLYGENPRVMTQMELEAKLKEGLSYKNLAMIQCVGARVEGHPSCSRTCCIEAVKNSIILKKRNPEGKIFIIFRDIMTFGKYEDYYRKSQAEYGVQYVRYVPERPPRVETSGDKLKLMVYDALLQKELELEVDYLVLSTPQVPPEGIEEIQKALKVPRSPDGFFMEAHAKLRPLEFSSEGIFLCGNCQSPKEVSSIIAQASGAASKACALLSKGEIETEAITAVVNEDLCIGCGRCTEVCPFSAISLIKNSKGESKALVNDALCAGCGTCASVCPNGAINPRHFEKAQIIAMIDELMEVPS
jgi:heterodisulfide reductase subunit A